MTQPSLGSVAGEAALTISEMIPMSVGSADTESGHQSLLQRCSSGGFNDAFRKLGLAAAFTITIIVYMMQSKVYEQPRGGIAEIVKMESVDAKLKYIRAVTWNIAAVNNNPFEYWITNADPNYNRIMSNVSSFIDTPGANDVPVRALFTEAMFQELEQSMIAANWTGVAGTRVMWDKNLKNRKIISEFLRDAELGKKRLISMPDRVTNTINTVNEGAVMRPTVVNCYNSADLSTINLWWIQWREFMFKKEVTVRKKGVSTVVKVRDMLSKIKRSKYPSITAAEEEISIPLQTLCAAIFDAILIAMMNAIDKTAWQPLREDMCNKLNRKKTDRITQILQTTYATADIQFLQEVASSYADAISKKPLANIYDVYYPATMDADRDQNSYILLKKKKFKDVLEVTSNILKQLDSSKDTPVSNGDLMALTATDVEDGTKYIFVSFHGDTNGLATIPIVTATIDYAESKPNYKLLFGLDANTYNKPEVDQQGMVQFAEYYTSKDLNSCYGKKPNPLNFTTFHARTHLQPQLNKAVRLEDKGVKGDKNPKDFILFYSSDFTVISTNKDNTGDKIYIENMVFPTLSFPSDHGVTSTVLIEKIKKSSKKDKKEKKIEKGSKSKSEKENSDSTTKPKTKNNSTSNGETKVKKNSKNSTSRESKDAGTEVGSNATVSVILKPVPPIGTATTIAGTTTTVAAPVAVTPVSTTPVVVAPVAGTVPIVVPAVLPIAVAPTTAAATATGILPVVKTTMVPAVALVPTKVMQQPINGVQVPIKTLP